MYCAASLESARDVEVNRFSSFNYSILVNTQLPLPWRAGRRRARPVTGRHNIEYAVWTCLNHFVRYAFHPAGGLHLNELNRLQADAAVSPRVLATPASGHHTPAIPTLSIPLREPGVKAQQAHNVLAHIYCKAPHLVRRCHRLQSPIAVNVLLAHEHPICAPVPRWTHYQPRTWAAPSCFVTCLHSPTAQ